MQMLIIPQHIIEDTMNEVVNRWLLPKFMELEMNATGEWRESVEVKTDFNKGEIWARDYSEQLSFGRKPGKRPPINPIERWVNAKLNIHGSQGKSIAFAVANKIAKEGTTWYQKGGSDLINVLNSAEVVEFVNSKIGQYLTSYVQSELFNELKQTFA